MGNWSELCNDVLGLIVDQFSAVEDVVHFGAVCRPWRSVSVKKLHFSTIADPWLMLAEKEDSDSRGFYSLSTQKVYQLNLPEARGRKCWSSCSWLITLGLDLEFHLLNPFSREQIRLPPQPTLPGQYSPNVSPEIIRRVFIQKVILSSRPSCSSAKTIPCEDDDKCVVMAICSEFRKLAFLRLGDEVWTPVESDNGIYDVVYFNGQFYAITYGGELLIVDISSPHPKTIEFAKHGEGINIGGYLYLVESVGELFLVAQEIYVDCASATNNNGIHETDGFDVYKFNFDNRKWTQVKNSLDNRALFVGFNDSFTIFPSKNHLGCEPNCIYFTDIDLYGLMKDGAGHDMGVFRMDTEEFDDHYVGPDIFTRVCAPLWICPSIKDCIKKKYNTRTFPVASSSITRVEGHLGI
ncbi:F-box protein At2g26160-like [Telopea speciosissima]|uniref:F-box protein At2g26160-like n=1 Tax=Telopea speciosissima TaxID=54955 RepID=UPI001CC58C93|nr:F-box protein At2g26160-like [Telopea speciosissima]